MRWLEWNETRPLINPTRYPTIDEGCGPRGADMGRTGWDGEPQDGQVRVFHLPLDSQGYDPGGAYWGHGERIYCATDGEDYRRFTRAPSREAAIRALGLAPAKLKVPIRFAVERHAKYLGVEPMEEDE